MTVASSDYRAYVLDENDHIVGHHKCEAQDSTHALEIARQFLNGHDVEVWQRTHIIGRLRHKSAAA